MTPSKTEIETACEEFLAEWSRHEWMANHGDWSDDGEYIEEGTIDPDDVSESAERLDVGRSSQGWNCQEGWRAYQVGDALYLNWWRSPYPHTDRHERDLWVLIDAKFFVAD